MEKYIMVLDAGTTNIKALLFDKAGCLVAQVRNKAEYIMEEPGQVEQDPVRVWELCRDVLSRLMQEQHLRAAQISSLGITTQRASFLFWDKQSGEPRSRIITWQDKRAAAYAAHLSGVWWFRLVRLIAGGLSKLIRIAKLVLISILKFDSVYASARTGFYLQNNPQLAAEIQARDTTIAWGTLDSWLIWNLSSQRLHVTDYSNASSTSLLDPFSLTWNTLVLAMFKIPVHILPELRETGDDFGSTTFFGGGTIPICSNFADQQASLFGQCCFEQGDIKCTNGTGSFIDLNTGGRPYASQRKLYPLVAWKYKHQTCYMLEGQSQNTGNIIDWIQHELGLVSSPDETETLACSVETTGGVYFLPAFTTGLTFPYWDATARGNIFGISLHTTRAQIVRAVLEGLCFRIKDIVDGIIADTGITVKKIKLDGGVSANRFILQFLADILGITVEYYANPEVTALGVAFMAGLVSGFWESTSALQGIQKLTQAYTPRYDQATRVKRYRNWQDIVRRSLHYRHLE